MPLSITLFCFLISLVIGPKLTKADMPPPRSYNAYLIFFTKYIKGLTGEHKPKSLKEISALAKDASSTWKNFTEAEKQVCFLCLRLPFPAVC